MLSLKGLLHHLWRRNVQPTVDPSPVDAIVRLLRETRDKDLRGGKG